MRIIEGNAFIWRKLEHFLYCSNKITVPNILVIIISSFNQICTNPANKILANILSKIK